MTWTINDLPLTIQNKPSHILQEGLQAANTAILKGLSNDEATFVCLQRIKALEGRSKPSPEPSRKVPEHVKQLLKARVQEPEVQQGIQRAFLGKNALPSNQDRNLVNAEFNKNDQLVLTFDTGETITTKSVAIKEYIEQHLSVQAGLTNPVDYLGFDLLTDHIVDVGELAWNEIDGTLDLGMKGGEVTLQIGQEQLVRVLNNTATDMLEMQVVRISGAQGNRLTAELSIASNATFADNTFAVVTEPILKNHQGFCTTSGLVREVNTSGFPEGADLYLSATVAGAITITPPVAPARIIRIGYCVRSHAVNGSIFVAILEHPDIVELGSTLITAPQNNDVLTYESSTGLWKNKPSGPIPEGDEVLAKRVNFIGEDIIYKGEAPVGTLDAASFWRIRKILIAVDGDVTETWANGNANYDKVWNDHASYTYS
jgi:hypothetical protein